MNQTSNFPSIGQAALLCLGVVALQMTLFMPLEVLGMVLRVVYQTQAVSPTQHPLALGIVNLMSLGLVLGFGARWARAPLRELFPLRRVRPMLLVPIVLTMAGAIILLSEVDNLFRAVLPVPDVLREHFLFFTEAHRHPVSGALAFVLVAPVTEELLFRGLILRGFVRRYPLPKALLVSAGLFALTHLNPWQFCSAAALGVVFGWWVARTGSLWPGLIGHALVNAAVVFYKLLPVQIPGFNAGDLLANRMFQPLWFDAAGAGLALTGGLLFLWLQPRPPPFLRPSATPAG